MSGIITITLPRKQLYEEIWSLSVSGVAKKYHLHYQKLINSCKEANIPFPSSGYWTRRSFGKDVSNEIIALPESDIENVTLLLEGQTIEKEKLVQNEKIIPEDNKDVEKVTIQEKTVLDNKSFEAEINNCNLLLFLEDEERKNVLREAYSLEIRENKKMHAQVIKYRESITEWKKKEQEQKNNPYYRPRYNRNNSEVPLFINEVSTEVLQRVMRILDALFFSIEKLGGKVNYDLSMQIKDDIVRVSFVEGQDKIEHELTKQEAKALVEYNDAIRFGKWASKPQIRKYDYIYNGKLRIVLGDKKFIRDNENEKIEGRLDDILIYLYEKSEETRIIRERREEQQRQRLEVQRLEEEHKNRKELELKRTKELVNKAEDFRVACEIRQFIAAIENSNKNDIATMQWIDWAKNKADWFDPTKEVIDEYLGKREHSKSKEEKELYTKANYNRNYNW